MGLLLAALTCVFPAAGPRPKLDGVAFLVAGEGGDTYSADEKRIDGTIGEVLKHAFTIRIAPPCQVFLDIIRLNSITD